MNGDFQAFLGRFSPKNTPASLFILFISGSDFEKCAEKLFGEGVAFTLQKNALRQERKTELLINNQLPNYKTI